MSTNEATPKPRTLNVIEEEDRVLAIEVGNLHTQIVIWTAERDQKVNRRYQLAQEKAQLQAMAAALAQPKAAQ